MDIRGKSRIAVRGAVTLLAALALIATVSGAASAAPAKVAKPKVVRVAMHITGFDAAVAAANGYAIKTDATGRQYSVKTGAAASAQVITPNNQVDGNCGSSWIYYYARGNSSASISTGFTLFYPATSYWWFVRINDAGGQNNHIWAGGLASLYGWSAYKLVGGLSHGFSRATVSTSSSAILVNGGVCTSGGPTDWDYVY